LLTSEAASDYIRLINEGGAPLATASFALELPRNERLSFGRNWPFRRPTGLISVLFDIWIWKEKRGRRKSRGAGSSSKRDFGGQRFDNSHGAIFGPSKRIGCGESDLVKI